MAFTELKEVDFPKQTRRVNLNTGLNPQAREKISANLKGILADTYLLMLKTHYYHWNVTGSLFKSLHDLTEEQYTELFEGIDYLAERIRALGHEAPGSFSTYGQLSEINDARGGLSDMEMTADLLDSHETIVQNLRTSLREADDEEDEVTVDIMVERLSLHEKSAWMLRSLIEK